MYALDDPIDILKGTSTITKGGLHKLGIATIRDLLQYAPSRHDHYPQVFSLSDIAAGTIAPNIHGSVEGTVSQFENVFTRKRYFTIQRLTLHENNSSYTFTFFNQPYLRQVFKVGQHVSLAGKIAHQGGKLDFLVTEYDSQPIVLSPHTRSIVPVYSVTRGLTSRLLRQKIFKLRQEVELPDHDILPPSIGKIGSYKDVILNLHFPDSTEQFDKAQEAWRLLQLYKIQLTSMYIKQQWHTHHTRTRLKVNPDDVNSFVNALPFQLTDSQKRAVDDICNDLAQPIPMNRLLQGDVGSGKTIVAAIAAHIVTMNKGQTLFTAPTEVLAQQHFNSLLTLYKEFQPDISIQLLTGSSKPAKEHLEGADIIVGTHALFTKKHIFPRVELVVIDEQQKFGVAQRAYLAEKGTTPHILSMTATPIPRTVMLAAFRELDMSIIDEMPLGRLPIKTFVVPQTKREACYDWIAQQISQAKAQVYIVCPLIEESDKETMKDVKAVTQEYEIIRKKFLKAKVGLLHGRLKSAEKEKVIADFKEGTTQILVATSVIEVGVDIPQATIMLIEGADRFGLAQLHQLRGRVGRSDRQSYCYVCSLKSDDRIKERLSFFANHTDGRKLAEYDLSQRGGGNMFGTQQHGISDISLIAFTQPKLFRKAEKLAEKAATIFKGPKLHQHLADMGVSTDPSPSIAKN